MREHCGDRVIVTADNSTHPVVKEGAVTIEVNDQASLKLHDVYHVPGLTKNLISVPQITESGKYVLFGPSDVKILDNVNEMSADVLFYGKKKGSLFVMTAGEAYVKKTSQTDNAAIWHARLGHVGYQLLQQISSKGLVDGIPSLKNVRENAVCQGCQFGKSHRLPYKSSSNRRSARRCVFVGYDPYRKGWRCMDSQTKKFTTSRDVVFDEVSTTFPTSKSVILNDSSTEILFPEVNEKISSDDEKEKQTPPEDDESNEQATRRSTRDRRQPQYLNDYEVSEADSSLFVKTESNMQLLVLLYVDDMIMIGSDEDEISSLRHNLSLRFDMKNLGEVDCFLGLEPSHPIASAIFTPNNASFPSVLQAYIRNLRFNNSYTPKPNLIITASHVSHVRAAVVCAQKHNLHMKIRSGGHDYEGVSYVAVVPFFILDMFNLRSIHVDIAAGTAYVQAGATLGEVYYRIAEKSDTHGFPAGGRLLDRKSMGEDLFWAIRGGGGASFGVIISYKLRLVRVPKVVTVFQVRRTLEENATNIVYKWEHVAPNIDNDLFIRLILDVVNSTSQNNVTNKTVRGTFIALFLGDSKRLLSIMKESFPELGLKESDCIETSWLRSVLFWTNINITTPVEILLDRTPQSLNYLKRKSDYVKEGISKEGLEGIWKKMIELENTILYFNPYGGRMADIPATETPFPHRAGYLWKVQYQANWHEAGKEVADYYINLTRKLHSYMTLFVSKNPREVFFNYKDLDLGINQNGKNNYEEGRVYGVYYFKENFDKLVQIKTKVDPHNFFRHEQSIPTKRPNQKR
ncbi:berberine bridge enzyme-like 8 [Senna tora]|uniref:Berberine bridge enzyme-like 8 n=1 Tax=Senna tora TaxID=362788 RepID=A0A834XE26_9FABA|nr:berberine bridge enzyme-like 8 [Senna tora]